MSDYRSNVDLKQAAQIMGRAQHITVTTHAKPDGDAFGCVVALTAALRSLGKQVAGLLMPPIIESFRSLPGYELIQTYEKQSKLSDTDLVVIADTGASSQLEPMAAHLEAHLEHTLIVDHHLSGDLSARWRYIDGEAAACCQIVAELLEPLGVKMEDPVIHDALFVGIVSDTGWFRFSNTRPRTHEIAARLLRAGVDHAHLYATLQQSEKPEKLALMIRALDSLQFLAHHSAAMMIVRADDFADTGTDMRDTEQLVDIPQMVASVGLVVLICEPPRDGSGEVDQRIRISFRSKPGPEAIDVNLLSGRFGGGGHARAAGAKIHAPLEQVVSRVRDTLLSPLS